MSTPSDYSFARYLAAKKTVDDRALNRHVWAALHERLADEAPNRALRVLEIGAGIGTMVERVLEWNLFPGDVDYTALDARPDNMQEASTRLPHSLAQIGYEERKPETLGFTDGQCNFSLHLETADVFEFVARQSERDAWDLLIANAFIDIVNIPDAIMQVLKLLKPGGLFYLTLTFDGVTAFEPIVDDLLDEQIERLYHANMDARRVRGMSTGGSRAGRALLHHLVTSRVPMLAAGASDWVVYPGANGYPDDEAYFLHFIIRTIEQALSDHPGLDEGSFADWLTTRHQQVEDAELLYLAHQIDVLGQRPSD